MRVLWIIAVASGVMFFMLTGLFYQVALWALALCGAYIVLRFIVNIINKDDLLEGIGWRK